MVFGVKIVFRDNDCTECWNGVFYKKLSRYPDITEWEIQTVIDFIAYEKEWGRECTFEGDNAIIDRIVKAQNDPLRKRPPVPGIIHECTACPSYKGCMTEYVCHTASVENAAKILRCGELLSAVNARGTDAETLMKEKRNAACDPADYFHYVMFTWGNCQAGDRLVMERKLGRFPDEKDLSTGFTPGVRFYFRYDKLISHPDAVFDGVLPLKIKDRVVLKDWVYAIIIPEEERERLHRLIPSELEYRTYYVNNDCGDIWQWSEKVYETVRNIRRM